MRFPTVPAKLNPGAGQGPAKFATVQGEGST